MREYFVDTWFLIAYFDPADSGHLAARQIERRLGSWPFVTHDGVFFELLAMFSDEGAAVRRRGVRLVRESMARWTVVPADRERFLKALSHYDSRPDKEYSLVDCMSMTIMRERGITHVLSNDHHFSQEGFTLVNA